MGDYGDPGYSGASTVRKKRSATVRRPRPNLQSLFENHDLSPPSAPSSQDASGQSPAGSSDHDSGVWRREVNLNSLIPKASSINRNGGFTAPKSTKKYDGSHGEYDQFYHSGASRPGSSGSKVHKRRLSDLKQSSGGVVAPAYWKSNGKDSSSSADDIGSGKKISDTQTIGHLEDATIGSADNKLRKVKLKLGGVTHTISAKSNVQASAENGSSKLSCPSDATLHRQKRSIEDDSHGFRPPQEKLDAWQGAPWDDIREGVINCRRREASQAKPRDKNVSSKQIGKPLSTVASESVRKSKRVTRRQVLEGSTDDEDEDDEIRYLERLKASKIGSNHSAKHVTVGSEGTTKQKSSRVHKRASYEEDRDFSLSQRTKEGRKKSRSEGNSEDMDSLEEEEAEAESDVSEASRKRQKKGSPDSLDGGSKEVSLTTRQRALQSAKDGSGGNSTNVIEFPDGLPPPPTRKQKDKLSEVEQQLKKAEAAQRRRVQVEKAAREAEAEAIKKILGQDSSRKKREEKLQKRRDELAQAKAARSMEIAANSVRWVMGPNGTTVTFPEGVELPSIFNSGPCSYPPPRERCAGPSCTNAYKYRDSKTNLPLCSLHCYRAVQQSTQPVRTC